MLCENMNDHNILLNTGDDFTLAKRTNLKQKGLKARDLSPASQSSCAIYTNIGLSCQREKSAQAQLHD
jgi:hypothetical protein